MTLKAQATGPNVPAHYDNHNSSDHISCIVSWLHEVVLSINRVWVLVVSTTRPELSDRRKCIKRSRNARGSQVRLIKIARRIFRVFLFGVELLQDKSTTTFVYCKSGLSFGHFYYIKDSNFNRKKR